MDEEQKKAAHLELAGQAREEALDAFRAWLEGHRLSAPPVEPLALDFGLGDFRRVGLIECWIANEKAAGYCGKQLFVFDGQRCPLHRHRAKHETFFVVAGEVDMDYDGQTRLMRPGDVLAVEPWKYHSFVGVGDALLLELSTPCEVADNDFHDPRIHKEPPALASMRKEG